MILDFIKQHWEVLLMAILPLAEVIIRLTPTKTDDTIFSYVLTFLDAILPSKTKKGGSK